MAIEKPVQTRVAYDNDNDSLLTAVSEAMWHVGEAMDELRGFGEYEDWFNTMSDMYDEMEREKDERESYASGEEQAVQAEIWRDREHDLLWDSQYDG